MPQAIQQKLQGLRLRLTGWIVVDGLVWLCAAVLLFAGLDMALDRFFKMDFAQRAIMLCLIVAGLLAIAFWRLFRPLLVSPSNDALILQVEKNNPELRENLISSVQLSRAQNVQGKGMSDQLVQSTVEAGVQRAGDISFGTALDRQRGGVNLILLLVLVAGLAGIGIGIQSGNEFLQTWFSRNVLLQNQQWPQNTYLVFPDAEDGVLTGTRGRDLRIVVQVDEGRSVVKDVAVELEMDDGKSRNRQVMKKAGEENEFQHVLLIRNVTSEFRIRASGGDDVTQWVEVKLVDEPSVSSMQLTAVLPEYVGQQREIELEGSGPHPVLRGSKLSLVAKVNKPLSVAQLTLAGESMPLEKVDENTYRLELPAEGSELQGGKYVFDLADLAGKTSDRPAAFSIKIREDKPPLVRASLNGISGLIVPKAVLPFSFSAADEFGLTKLAFRYSYVSGDGSVPVEKEVAIPLAFPEGQQHQRSTEQSQRLDLRPDEIPVGVTFRLNIFAWDNQPIADEDNPPDPGQSREFLLRVVTEDELREDLLRREVEQRGAFEQAYSNQLDLQSELRALAASLPEKAEDAGEQQRIVDRFFDDRVAELLALHRRQKIIGTNIMAVADRFSSFMVEAENNRLDENLEKLGQDVQDEIANRSFKQRVGNDIVDPIVKLDANEITAAFQGIDTCRRMARDQERFRQQVEATAEIQEQILQKMSEILRAMEQSESFQQIVNGLIKVKVNQEEVGSEVDKTKDKENVLPDIFDDLDGDAGSKDDGAAEDDAGKSDGDKGGEN